MRSQASGADSDRVRGGEGAADPAEVPAPPYVFIGKMVEQDGAALAFLERGDRVYSVRAGDLIDDEYRVELIDQNALVLTYLPLSLRQTVPNA